MANPGWFDPEYYASEKLKQMNATQYQGHAGWTTEAYQHELLNWKDEMGYGVPGLTAADKAYSNFLACNGKDYANWIGLDAINVSCNSYFDVGVYLQNLADYANRGGVSGLAPGGWTANSMASYLLHDLHTSAWEHYTTFGMTVGLNPSNTFDTKAWFADRAEAMNKWQGAGWLGRDDWTNADVSAMLATQGINPIQDMAGQGATLGVKPKAPAAKTEVAADFNPWLPALPPDPYDQNVASVVMTQAANSYSGRSGQNTSFECVWTNAASTSTLSPTDIINGGEGAYNTLAVELSASWPGFSGSTRPNVTNIGRLSLTHSENNASSPYTFDAANIQGLKRVDLNDTATGAISLKGLGAGIETINISGLSGQSPTTIEYASGAVAGQNDALTLGVTGIGSQGAAAPIGMSGIERLTVNAMLGQNYIDLRGALGLQTLKATGGGDLVATGAPNSVTSYDASESTGDVNFAAGNLTAATVVKGGYGWDTLTLSQAFRGAPQNWTGIESLALNPGATANISCANISGLQSLWLHSDGDAILTNIPATGRFVVYQANSGGKQPIIVDGAVANLAYTTTGFAAQANGAAAPVLNSNAQHNVDIHATGETTLAGNFNLTQAAGRIGLHVQPDATFGSGVIIAKNATSFIASIEGRLDSGAVFNVVDGHQGGSVSISAARGITPIDEETPGRLRIDADAATSLIIETGGPFSLASGSSLQSCQKLAIDLTAANASFDSTAITLPQIQSIAVSGEGGSITLGDIGSQNLASDMLISAEGITSFKAGSIQTGGSGNIIANISVSGEASFSTLQAGGDAQLTIAASEVAVSSPFTIQAGDIFVDLHNVTGQAFTQSAPVSLAASENLVYVGAQGSDFVRVGRLGQAGVSSIRLDSGADELTISANALATGQQAALNVDLGSDTANDIIEVQTQRSGRLAVYISNFTEGEDRLEFDASQLASASAAQSLLSAFGLTGIAVTDSMLYSVGSATGIYYDNQMFLFSSNATTLVALAGVNPGSLDLDGPELLPDAGA